MKKNYSILLLLFITQFASAQHNSVLDNFTVNIFSGKVLLNWIITSGSTCNGIQIYRSTDGKPFVEIGSIAGVCGSTSSPKQYDFTDVKPVKNSINCYRLELGGNGTSEVLSLEIIDIAAGGYQIRPNPVSTNAKIYFDNNKKEEHQFVLYNLSGTIVTTIITKEDFFDFNAINLISGLYLFAISNDSFTEKARGRILVQH
ncbi:MAG: T9SS type A sorting domain-containing protein [Bacteroidetes bacterium]|nr:T9SS type A sorting domain-containing protein [Bacteroidota bacterium]